MDLLSKLLVEDISEILANGARDWLTERGTLLAQLLVNKEVLSKVGERNARMLDRNCFRWGSQHGSVLMAEQRVPIDKPRVRGKNGEGEIELLTYSALNDKDFLNEMAAAKLLSGVSTRNFESVLEKLLDSRGISRQTISKRGMEEMQLRLEEFQVRSLDGAEMVAVFIDGIGLADTVYVAALGSMSRKGDCWDNAVAETFWKTLKAELTYRQVFKTREAARQAIFEYIETFYKKRRLHSTLDYLSPVEFELKVQKAA